MIPAGDAGPLPLAGRRVLIVEDRYLIAAELADEVSRLGGEVVGPSSSVEGARRLLDEGIDLGLLDVDLDGEVVYPLAQDLVDRGVAVIFTTGYDDEVLPGPWRDRPRLRKPVSERALRDELMRM